jgi:SAM-dependent methyltransferase
MPSRSLLDAYYRLGAAPYDWMYLFRAPWESGPRPALVQLCTSGRLTPEGLSADGSAPARAIDLGCGSGADSIYLARRGFEVTGIDFSPVAISKAEHFASLEGPYLETTPRFVVGDLRALPSTAVPGPFDLLFDGGTLDDFPPEVRPRVGEAYTALARPGAVLVLWCFYASAARTPRLRASGPSRWGAAPLVPGEETAIFGRHWEIERFRSAQPLPRSAVFVMTRR